MPARLARAAWRTTRETDSDDPAFLPLLMLNARRIALDNRVVLRHSAELILVKDDQRWGTCVSTSHGTGTALCGCMSSDCAMAWSPGVDADPRVAGYQRMSAKRGSIAGVQWMSRRTLAPFCVRPLRYGRRVLADRRWPHGAARAASTRHRAWGVPPSPGRRGCQGSIPSSTAAAPRPCAYAAATARLSPRSGRRLPTGPNASG